MEKRLFYSKVMLFGEYGVIRDSMGLAVPYRRFWGKLSFPYREENIGNALTNVSNRQLIEYLKYLMDIQNQQGNVLGVNLEELEKDLKEGLYFNSGIPQRYGIGSSGALVASIYDRYAVEKPGIENGPSPDKILDLKTVFAKMESCFHGVSSGFDPLLSYFGRPLLIRSKTAVQMVDITERKGNHDAVFLMDTGSPGETGPLVKLFARQCENADFLDSLYGIYIPAVNGSIDAFLSSDSTSLFRHLHDLSEFQYEHFHAMIPDHVKDLWRISLHRDDFRLKLCGSGGGGYMLGYSNDLDVTKDFLAKQKQKIIPFVI